MHASLRIQLFGVPQVEVGPHTAHEFPTKKGKFLFYYLLLFRGQPQPREMLESIFWGEHSGERARRSLSTELWRLRRWLHSYDRLPVPELVVDDGAVQMQVQNECWLDTRIFEEGMKQARRMLATAPEQAAGLLKQAIGVYHGDLLTGCYYDWCLSERQRMRQLYLDALLQLTEHHKERHEYLPAIEYAQELVRQEPLREDAHGELMKLYALNGQTAQAVAQYQHCETILQNDLGIEPQPETRLLLHQVLTAPAQRFPVVAAMEPSAVPLENLRATLTNALTQLDDTRHELQEALRLVDQLEKEAARPSKRV